MESKSGDRVVHAASTAEGSPVWIGACGINVSEKNSADHVIGIDRTKVSCDKCKSILDLDAALSTLPGENCIASELDIIHCDCFLGQNG